MKSIKNYLLAVLALATILTVVSCKNEDGPSIVASYTGEYGGKAAFYDDGTFRVEGIKGGTVWSAEGTYSGNLNMNGAIALNCTKYTENGAGVNAGGMTITIVISYNGKELMLYFYDDYDEAEKFTRD